MKHCIILILFTIIAFSVDIQAQDNQFIEGDSIVVPVTENDSLISEGFLTFSDSLVLDSVPKPDLVKKALPKPEPLKLNPTRAILYSAVFPGLGQIYNRKYWKLPIVYGGFLGCVYAVTWNGNQYDGYKNAYKDFTDDKLSTDSWEAYRTYNMQKYDADPANWQDGERTWFKNALKRKRDFYRRNRDLSYIATIGLYAICMIDAYVDAQLFDFDISQDLSLRVDPVFIPQTTTNARTFGLQCSLTF